MTVDAQGRPLPPLDGDETATATGFLDFQRATLAWKCDGLDDAGLRATVGASSMTLAGILKHLAWVELYWFVFRLHGRDPGPPWNAVDWGSDPDWDWASAAEDSPAELLALWRSSADRARRAVQEALADGGLGRPLANPQEGDEGMSLRFLLLHMVEEYARHNGHADLLRESVDGATGE